MTNLCSNKILFVDEQHFVVVGTDAFVHKTRGRRERVRTVDELVRNRNGGSLSPQATIWSCTQTLQVHRKAVRRCIRRLVRLPCLLHQEVHLEIVCRVN